MPAYYTKYASYAPRLDQYAAHLKNADRHLGSETLGKAKIDCRLLASQCNWAILGQPPEQFMTGLLFLKLQFYQPLGYALEEATIHMSFDSPITPGTAVEPGPAITAHHPSQLCGEAAERHIAQTAELNPSVETGSVGGSLGSISRTTDYTRAYRWTFIGQTHVSKDSELYNRMTWRWEDQGKGSPLSFERPIYAAVVVQHNTKPILIKVDIEGKLKSLRKSFQIWKLRPKGTKARLIEPVKIVSADDIELLIQGLEKDIMSRNEKFKARELVAIEPATRALSIPEVIPIPDNTQPTVGDIH